jgi:HK97 family phage prohead protease
MRFYGNLTKIDEERRMVWGYASTEAVDGHGEIVLKSAIEDALTDYMEFANIREMHQLSAVGTTEEASVDDRGLYIAAKVIDDTAWGKINSGVYKGFSIGGKVLTRDKEDKKIITKIALNEISLVDRPSNPEARFDVWKAAGADSIDPVGRANALLDTANAAIAKVRKSESTDAILKIIQSKDDEINRLNKRVEELLAEPTPPKTAGRYGFVAVSKEQDSGCPIVRQGAAFARRNSQGAVRNERRRPRDAFDQGRATAAPACDNVTVHRMTPLVRIELALRRIEATLAVADAMCELAARRWRYDS